MTASRLRRLQARKLRSLLRTIRDSNAFYRRKLEDAALDPKELDERIADPEADPRTLLSRLPFTEKQELLEDQAASPPYGTNLTFPLSSYVRVHETSGTSGVPLRWLDTRESWAWFVRSWQTIYRAAEIGPEDRVLLPFSFGPFIGFWGAFEAARENGSFCVPAGGLSSVDRLRSILLHRITVVACTPTYALRLAEVAREEGIDLSASSVHTIIVAGEPGGSIDTTRSRIEEAWKARVLDHCGMTEVGAFGYQRRDDRDGLRVAESEFIVEVLAPGGVEPVEPGELGELVITNLGRIGSPVVRYRTGDLVRWVRLDGEEEEDIDPCSGMLQGGILSRIDDMVFIRGNNVYPSAVEALLRRFCEVAEYRVVVIESGHLSRLVIELEPSVAPDLAGSSDERGRSLATRVAQAIRDGLRFQADVEVVPPGTLPRFEHKARRFVRKKAP
ncbi:MAG TPA: AMP-binding protein [Planctomycetota bacterium]|nr:AMP-binding protein [Planctomycetota bacterium]